MSSLAQREKIAKKLQLLRDQREREQRAFEQLPRENENLTAAEMTALAMKKAEESAPRSVCVDGVEICIGDRVRVCKDVARFMRSEQVNVLVDPVKSIYLGETGKIVQVLQSLKGKPAVELCFADDAEKIFFADCLDVEDARRRKTNTSAVSRSSNNNNNSSSSSSKNHERNTQMGAIGPSVAPPAAPRPAASQVNYMESPDTPLCAIANSASTADETKRANAQLETAPQTLSELDAPGWNDLKRYSKTTLAHMTPWPALARKDTEPSQTDMARREAGATSQDASRASGDALNGHDVPQQHRKIEEKVCSTTSTRRVDDDTAFPRVLPNSPVSRPLVGSSSSTTTTHVDPFSITSVTTADMMAANDQLAACNESSSNSLLFEQRSSQDVLQSLSSLGVSKRPLLVSELKHSTPASEVKKTKAATTPSKTSGTSAKTKWSAKSETKREVTRKGSAARNTHATASPATATTTATSSKKLTTHTSASVVSPLITANGAACVLPQTKESALLDTSNTVGAIGSSISISSSSSRDACAVAAKTALHSDPVAVSSPHAISAGSSGTSQVGRFQRLGLVKEALSDRVLQTCDEELGKPDELLYLHLSTPQSLSVELDHLLDTPRNDSVPPRPTPPIQHSAKNKSVCCVPRSGPANYRARFALTDRATCIPRLGAPPARVVPQQKQQQQRHQQQGSGASEKASAIPQTSAKDRLSSEADILSIRNIHRDAADAMASATASSAAARGSVAAMRRTPHAGTNNSHHDSSSGGSVPRVLTSSSAKQTEGVIDSGDSASHSRATGNEGPEGSKKDMMSRHSCSSNYGSGIRTDAVERSEVSGASVTDSTSTKRKIAPPKLIRPHPSFASVKLRQVRVYENGIYDEDEYEHAYRVVTVRANYKTMKALRSVIERELGWRDGKRVDILYDASGAEIDSLDELFDGESIVASAGNRFIVPFPNTSLHREALKMSQRASSSAQLS